jgi:receptor protein-tyrosine kinase
MSIIEQANRRLEQLRRSGIEIPPRGAVSGPAVADLKAGSAPERLLSRIESKGAGVGAVHEKARARPVEPKDLNAEPASRSKEVHIDVNRLTTMGFVTPNTPRSQIADEFRVIKRPLLANIQAKPVDSKGRPNLVMVTSSVPGEGKTFVAVNLAISMAMELDKTVLLVDADVSRPSVLERLALGPAPGLLDMLTRREADMSYYLLRTNIEKLSLLPAGAPHGKATELLASDAMNRLLDELAERYSDRIVVFDAPPLLPSTESRVLATHMGQIVMVVEAERTPVKTVQRGMATLEACPVVLPLLNKTARSEVGFYYGSYGPHSS